ncbi:unnamed protein product [Photorhabdus laumondii subsp. laumondii TTO1]|uniref:Photorhabdus luminescens subsp. laumondii TTO1 complete genome segment 17/17 n=1 Tax=Photorhabdus laumondii subsp. laumondii (strain DSM 15139 / CIP 105565 / TT01) TaxID=243265 RepID=Q7MY57_PHOLL|nr:unnamed protein product [Photorhabdus laumondii subsp. laumondii TTO1]
MVQCVIDHITVIFSSLRGSQQCSLGTALHQTHDENQITILSCSRMKHGTATMVISSVLPYRIRPKMGKSNRFWQCK